MAVQAQPHLSNAFFSTTSARMNVLDELPMQQYYQIAGAQSELTYCNGASGSRKRGREEHQEYSPPVAVDMNVNSHNLPIQFHRYEQQKPVRAVDSAETSTSGGGGPVLSPLAVDLYSHIYRHNVEIDSIVNLQSERLRFVLEESRKRQCRSLISVLESKLATRLKEKEAELEIANSRNAELEERIRQLSSENEVWFNVAKNNEAIVTSLEQLLLGANANAVAAAPAADVEGYGDSDGGADDAQSCCFEGDAAGGGGGTRRRLCRVCGRNDVGVLLLPCRHLCVCKDCESKVDTCPICSASKNASLHIFMS